MLNTRFPRYSLPIIFLIAYILCLHTQVDAARIIRRAASSKTASNTIANNATPKLAIVLPSPTKTTELIPKTKENIEDDLIENINKKAGKEDDEDEAADDDDDEDSSDKDVDDYDIDNDDEDYNNDKDNEDDGDGDYEEKEANANVPTTKNATALQPAEKDEDGTTSSPFSMWGIVSTVWSWIRDDLSESIFGGEDVVNTATAAAAALVRKVRDVSNTTAVESRTFGKIRRMQMAMVPLIFKFGVLSAMVAFLIALGMKTLFLVKVLVLMNAAAILVKLISLKNGFEEHHHHATPTWNWAPPVSAGGWVHTAPAAPLAYGGAHDHTPNKEIHLHIHGGQLQGYGAGGNGVVSAGHGWESRSDPLGSYAARTQEENEVNNELNNYGPIGRLPTRYPPHPRY